MTIPLVTIAVDPGARSGVSVYVEADLAYATAVQAPTGSEKVAVLQKALKLTGLPLGRGSRPETPVHFAVENQFLAGLRDEDGGGGDESRFPSARSVAWSAGGWMAVADLLGLIVHDPVGVSSWRAVLGLNGSPAGREALLFEVLSRHFDVPFLRLDADRDAAAGIGLYQHLIEAKREGRADLLSALSWVEAERLSRLKRPKSRRKGHGDDSIV